MREFPGLPLGRRVEVRYSAKNEGIANPLKKHFVPDISPHSGRHVAQQEKLEKKLRIRGRNRQRRLKFRGRGNFGIAVSPKPVRELKRSEGARNWRKLELKSLAARSISYYPHCAQNCRVTGSLLQ